MIVKTDTLPTIYCACRDCPFNGGRNDCTRPEEIEVDTGGRCIVGVNAVARSVTIPVPLGTKFGLLVRQEDLPGAGWYEMGDDGWKPVSNTISEE